MRKIILASNSPRRKELLGGMGITFTVVPSDFDEWLDDTMPPEEVANKLAYGKAFAVARKNPEAIVIGSDTIVTIDGKQLGKAIDEVEAIAMWKSLAGKSHKVTTSITVLCLAEKYEFTIADNTFVFMKPYDEHAVREYLTKETYIDKAGAYAIQDVPYLIDHIEGDIQAVIGFPTRLLDKPFSDLGVSHG